MFERFTDRSRRVLVLAQEEARLLEHSFIGTEHILLGLLREENIATRALQDLDIRLELVRARVQETIGLAGTPPSGAPPFTPRAKRVLELSLREAMQLGHNVVGPEHMLLGLVREGEGVAAQVLVSFGAGLAQVRQKMIQLLAEVGPEYVGTGVMPPLAPGARMVRPGQVVECSFCGRRSPQSGQIVAGRGGAYICEHCVQEWVVRLDGATGDEGPEPGETAGRRFTVHFHGSEGRRGESVPTVDLALADDKDDATRTVVRITGVPDEPGTVAHLFGVLTDHSVDVSEIVSTTSENGTLDISFAVSKATEPAFMSAYSQFHQWMLGPDPSS